MSDKIIAVIGVSEEESAHLRLLMRSCAAELEHRWHWGSESGADLVVVDPGAFAGQMARTRALGAGVRCVVFSDRPGEADLILQRPLRRADVIAVLNRAGSALVRHPDITGHDSDFYTRDIGEAVVPAFGADAAPAPGLDDALRPQPLELRAASQRPAAAALPRVLALEALMDTEVVEPPSARTGAISAPSRRFATHESVRADTAPRSLREYLDGDVLTRPARFALPGAPPLTLDPKNKVAHAPAGLAALAPYCDARWGLADWQPLTTADLADVRETQPALSYSRLTWLDVLQHSGGQLARHLHPGGIYRLRSWVEVDKDSSRYVRIASALLQPARLHEIAAVSGAPMADVFDVINAYDAIGLIEWQPRPRGDEDRKPTSLLGKLRKPFGKT